MKRILLILFIIHIQSFSQTLKSDLIKDNLKGKVKSTLVTGYFAEKKNGKIVATINITALGISSTKYNNKGNISEEKHYSYRKGNELVSTHTYEFNAKNQIIKKKEVSWMGTYLYTYEYDLKDNNLEEIVTENSGKLISKFDKNTNRIEESYHPNDGSAGRKTIYKYDDLNNLIEENNVNDYYDIYEYNTKRNVIKKTRYSSEGKLYFIDNIVYTKYDSKGNWIEHITYDKNDEPVIITKRKIEYY